MVFKVAGGMKPGAIIEIEKRFYQLLIVGKHKSSWAGDELGEDLLDAASKLEVEQQALRERIEKQQQQKSVFEAVSNQLLTTIISEMEHQLDSTDSLIAESPVSNTQWLLLELLHSKKLDMKRLLLVVKNTSWLNQDLVNLVNSPAFRQSRPQSTDVQLSDLKLVLNYIGMEQLKFLIPYFCMRHWLPNNHATILWITRKYWRFANMAAIAARALAQLHEEKEEDESLIFTLTLVNLMGSSLVLRKCAQVYEGTRGKWLREASESRDKNVYDAVLATEFPTQKVCDHVLQMGSMANWQVLELHGFGNSKLQKHIKEMDQTLNFSDLTKQSAIALKATIFAKVLLLEEQNQIDPREKKMLFDYYEFSEQEIIRLKSKNFRKQDIL
ncbi:histidine kinase [Shewanella sp. OPT22]|nr:histidine kinase [Shewanella sp. OPT22]